MEGVISISKHTSNSQAHNSLDSNDMPPRNRVIIDTDPGTDDIIALLLALSASSSELEVILISVVAGNVPVQACLRNVVALFHILQHEISWRKSQGLQPGYEGITAFKPVVAVGAAEPLHETASSDVDEATNSENADYFHGADGLGGSIETHPQFNPPDIWERLFKQPGSETTTTTDDPDETELTRTATRELPNDHLFKPLSNFTPSPRPAHEEILHTLRTNPANTITLISIGPLTNLALAAAADPTTFLRAKSLVSMGGTIDPCLGNVTPNAEFNVWADPHAAARIYALTSPDPATTMPILHESFAGKRLPAYPPHLPHRLPLTLFALDITEKHILTRALFRQKAAPLAARGSPLAQWMTAFLEPMLAKMEMLHLGHEGDTAALALHDPLCVYYLLTAHEGAWTPSDEGGWEGEDIRVETQGQWTRGMTVGDRRPRRRRASNGEVPHDKGNWLGRDAGNRVVRMLGSPGTEGAGGWMLDRILGYVQ